MILGRGMGVDPPWGGVKMGMNIFIKNESDKKRQASKSAPGTTFSN